MVINDGQVVGMSIWIFEEGILEPQAHFLKYILTTRHNYLICAEYTQMTDDYHNIIYNKKFKIMVS